MIMLHKQIKKLARRLSRPQAAVLSTAVWVGWVDAPGDGTAATMLALEVRGLLEPRRERRDRWAVTLLGVHVHHERRAG